jgi:hypothetical protein
MRTNREVLRGDAIKVVAMTEHEDPVKLEVALCRRNLSKIPLEFKTVIE